MMTTTPQNLPVPAAKVWIARWLFLIAALVAAMVVVGGATRLTGSGLSITEWRPITGAVPPLSEPAWQAEFAKYQEIPQYRLLNSGMTLAEFKGIYWWEWSHRLLGRALGVVFLVPLLIFIARRQITGALAWRLGGVFALGGLQGFVGWYMVASGLVGRVSVSQYRLAAHLGLALLLFALVLWTALGVARGGDRSRTSRRPKLFWGGLGVAALVYLQMILGAFVAGLHAGKIYNTWPLMDGRFVPEAYFSSAPRWRDIFENPAAAQFDHRIGAYAVTLAALAFAFAARRTTIAKRAYLVVVAVLFQVALGIMTLLAVAPLSLSLAHQVTALAVLAAALYAAHGAREV